ncbi:FRAS1-related extracellular matrix protein 2-like isoform X2 [Vidua chalybeata]|nr:FRAS1-related extracellular matrix protein 2-like isoform X2 [Vidua chalybeata]
MFSHFLAPKWIEKPHMGRKQHQVSRSIVSNLRADTDFPGLMLLYMHNDTESLEDSFTMQLTDGKRTVQGTLYIYIMPVNDEIPHLSRNMGLEAEAADKKPFPVLGHKQTPKMLQGMSSTKLSPYAQICNWR